MTRYPLADLLDAIGAESLSDAASRIGVSASLLHLALRDGLSVRTADRYAIAAGLHPAMVWSSFIDDGLTVTDRMFVDGGWRTAWLWREAAA